VKKNKKKITLLLCILLILSIGISSFASPNIQIKVKESVSQVRGHLCPSCGSCALTPVVYCYNGVKDTYLECPDCGYRIFYKREFYYD